MFFYTCSKDLEPKLQEGLEYIPLQVGNYWVYNVTKKTFTSNYSFSPIIEYYEDYSDTSIYQLKEKISDQFESLSGETTYSIERYFRKNTTEEWSLDSVWQCKIKDNLFVRNENNINYVKLSFPVFLGKNWDVDALNTIYRVDSGDCSLANYKEEKSYQNSALNLENVLVVEYCMDTTALKSFTELEYYAQNIGLVYKKLHKFEYCQTTDTATNISCDGLNIIESGIKLELELIEYHIEK